MSRFNLDRVPQLLEWCDANKIGVKFLELIEVRREIALINPRTTTRAHGWFGALYEETRGRLTDFSYNPSVMKFYAKTRSGQDVQFSENFCRFGACSQLWTRIDSSRRLVPCIQKPVTRDLPLTGRGIALVDEVNQEMTRRSMWPCANAEEPPTQDGDEYIVELPDGSTVALPTTERTGCIS